MQQELKEMRTLHAVEMQRVNDEMKEVKDLLQQLLSR
eukprot:COSAG06_NODE_2846_length_6186_cov_4.151799_3_plen_37_part_00